MNSTKKIVLTYAKSLFLNLKNNLVDNSQDPINLGRIVTTVTNQEKIKTPDLFFVGEELLLIRSLILSSKFFKKVFQNPTYSDQKKLDILFNILPGLSLSLKSFLKVLAEKSHLSYIPEVSDEYTKTLINFRNSTNVKIITASALKESSGFSLLSVLRKLTNSKEIILTVFYNPKLLGGLIIEYNSKSIDASILKEFSLFFNEA